jgi:type I restriction enzyme R subunit
MNFTESKLEQAVLSLFTEKEIAIPHFKGEDLKRAPAEVLLKEDLRTYLHQQYRKEGITEQEVNTIIRQLDILPASDLYGSNRQLMKWLADGFLLKREDRSQKDLYIQLIDYSGLAQLRQPSADQLDTLVAEKTSAFGDQNIYRIVNQLEIEGPHNKRIPDAIVYINGLPLVVFEFKTAVRENATIHDAWKQLHIRYQRDIPKLFVYNAFTVISDGVNSKAGTLFTPYEYYYAWRKVTGDEKTSMDGISSLLTLVKGMFQKDRLRDILRNFIYFPDQSKKDEKILCRYPQYYGTRKLFANILQHSKPEGDGKGGTYFGATGCGKSYIMLFLSRLLMRSVALSSPTLVLITDRTDLDDQLSEKYFLKAKKYIGDENIVSVSSRKHLRKELRGRKSGGVFLTTIHKFSEDTDLLTERSNVICISDEAHRSQVNLKQKVKVTKKGVKKTYGFAKHLHDSLPNATYVGFTGTPIDKTIEVFGKVVDAYTMSDSVKDEITVRIVYEGRAAKVLLDNKQLQKIEKYYEKVAEEGANEYQIEESKKATTKMTAILGDPDRLKAVAKDFVAHYEGRVEEGATVKGKAMFVCINRQIAYELYKEIIALRPLWAEKREADEGVQLTEKERKKIKPIEKLKMVMTRGKDDEEDMYNLLGTKDDRKELDRQFKQEKSNFKIAIVVDMWLTGFDVPFLDTIYIDKPIQTHNLIQTISRVNRTFKGKEKGLVIDYIGIKKKMNIALAMYSAVAEDDFEDVDKAVSLVKDQLDLLRKIFYQFDSRDYFQGTPLEQLHCLNRAAEYVQVSEDLEKRFMRIVRKLRGAYNLCCSNEAISQTEKDLVHFYFAIAAIVHKLTKGEAPDTAQMNAKVHQMIQEAIISEGVEEVFKIGEERGKDIDIFSDEHLAKIQNIDLPNTKVKLLQRLLKMAIEEFKKSNKVKGVDFSKRLQNIVERYNDRSEVAFAKNVLDDLTAELVNLFEELKEEKDSFLEMGIGFEEKAFYDILVAVAEKYGFKDQYKEEQYIELAKAVKRIVDDKAQYVDWDKQENIRAGLFVDLILVLEEHGYPPVTYDEVYQEILEQAEHFKKHQ